MGADEQRGWKLCGGSRSDQQPVPGRKEASNTQVQNMTDGLITSHRPREESGGEGQWGFGQVAKRYGH